MENNLFKAYAEVDKILSFMEKNYIEKVPEKMRDMFKNEALEDYKPNIRQDIPLDEQNLQRKTFAVLAMINLNYWCEDENEKQNLLQIYAKNDKIKEEKIREKYNPSNILKNKKASIQDEKTLSLTKYHEGNFLNKIVRKIKSFFKNNFK